MTRLVEIRTAERLAKPSRSAGNPMIPRARPSLPVTGRSRADLVTAVKRRTRLARGADSIRAAGHVAMALGLGSAQLAPGNLAAPVSVMVEINAAYSKDMRTRWALLGAAGLTLAVSAWFFFGRETPVSVGMNLLDCVKRLDATCLHRRMSEGERSDAMATVENLNKFLRTVVEPRLGGFEQVGEPEYEVQLAGRQAIVSQRMRHPDGRTVALAFSVTRTDDGIFCDGLIRQILAPCVMSAVGAGQPSPRGAYYATLWADSLEAWAPELNASGILGATMVNEVGLHQVLAWTDLIAKFREGSKPKTDTTRD